MSTFDVICKTHGFGSHPFWGLDVSCEHSNLTFIMHELKNRMNPTLNVLNTLLPAMLNGNTKPEEVDKTLLYFDSESGCAKAVKVLKKVLPPHLRGVVHSYSLTILVCGKTAIWDKFKSGKLQIICVTDVAGMGCNILDIKNTIVFALPQCPKSISVVIQCWQRTTCNHGISGTCQLLLPGWAFQLLLQEVPGSQKKEPKRSVKQHAGLQSVLKKFINV